MRNIVRDVFRVRNKCRRIIRRLCPEGDASIATARQSNILRPTAFGTM
ncbi:hypothetical protein BSLA_02f1773 [Burkholderia stabilis]|nr:hypothetical protein BSLA_02f1773 [Burkholderia stabilis]